MKKLVIVPAFNEENSLPDVIADLVENFPGSDILVVNDGSHDNTSTVASSSGAITIDLPYNLGIGGAVQTGFRYAQKRGYPVAIQVDGDGQHKANQISALLETMAAENADLVVGSRVLAGSGFHSSRLRSFGSKVLAGIVTAAIGRKITDPTSGFRAYGTRAIMFFSRYYPEDYPEVEALVLASKKGLDIREVAAEMRPRLRGRSSITLLDGVYYMIKAVLAISIDIMKSIK
jgi:glycosyltransferase involved in cell wall biosynthesis